MNIQKELIPKDKRGSAPSEITDFGSIKTDHMIIMEYHNSSWETPQIKPRGIIGFDPAAFGINYGGNVFEGQKAVMGEDGNVNLIRLNDHVTRINKSGARMMIPPIDEELNKELIKQLVGIECAWVPQEPGRFLYIRPNVIGTTEKMGLVPPKDFTYMITVYPCAPFFGEKLEAKPLRVETDVHRAAEGGTGQSKTGGNYAGSMMSKEESIGEGCIETLYADPFIQETGAANFYIIKDSKFITPKIVENGTILSGITRNSTITVAKDMKIPVEERTITLDEILKGIKDNSITEMGITGTAAVIVPIDGLKYNGQMHSLENLGEAGPITKALYDNVTGIYTAKLPDIYNWLTKVDKIE